MSCLNIHAALVLAVAAAAPTSADAQSVSLAGRMGQQALLIIDGKPHTLAAGASTQGVRFVRWAGEQAEVQSQGRVFLFRVGATPVSLGQAAEPKSAREIVIPAGTGGHFYASGSVNGKPVRFVVDTGATVIAMGRDEAQRLGLDLNNATESLSSTANGIVPTLRLTLTRVRIGEVEVSNVAASVLPQSMPYLLLGNSFLSRFQMRRDNDVMHLTLR